jgi:hypothetical protein
MSARNGDKARFGRLRKRRILLRNRIQKLRDAMEKTRPKPEMVAPQPDNKPSLEPRP